MFSFLSPKDTLGDAETQRGMSALVWDGVYAQTMMALSTGPFLIALALLLGASNVIIGVLAAIGPLAQILQVPAIPLVERFRRRKLISVAAIAVSRAALAGIVPAALLAPADVRLPLFLAMLALFFGAGAVGGCAFNSWIRDLIPTERLGAFFSRRLSASVFVGAAVSLAAGLGLDAWDGYGGQALHAYGAIYAIAGLSGALSLAYICRVPEPRMPANGKVPLSALLAEPFHDPTFRQLLFFLAAWSFAVNFAGPFFAVYMIDHLGLSMGWVLALSVTSQLINVLFFGVWGRLASQFSNKSVLAFTVPIFFLTFLLWPFTTMPGVHGGALPLLFVIHVIGGVSTAGVVLCAGNLAFKLAPYGKAANYMAANALVSGVMAALAPLLAGLVANSLTPLEIRLTLDAFWWEAPAQQLSLPTLDLRGLDFLFLLAFVFGMYSYHRLLAVREQGEVEEKVLRKAFIAELERMARQVSTLAGLRQIAAFPLGFLRKNGGGS